MGWEKLPDNAIRPQVPEYLKQESYTVFRHDGNLPFVDMRAKDTFYVFWIECSYGDLYSHGS